MNFHHNKIAFLSCLGVAVDSVLLTAHECLRGRREHGMGECGVGREGLEKLLVTSLLWEGFNPLEVLSRVSPKVLGLGWEHEVCSHPIQ